MKPENRTALEIAINDAQRVLAVRVDWLVDVARAVLAAEGHTAAEISVTLVDNTAIHRLNRQYLEHDWPTDVISFDLTGPGEPLAAELIISTEMAIEAAARHGVAPTAELVLYLIHGLLHMCGYDDQTEEQRTRMRRRERELMSRFLESGEDGCGGEMARSSGAEKGTWPCSV